MKKMLGHSKKAQLLRTHMHKFMKRAGLYVAQNENIYIGVSGGIDSVFLLHTLIDLYAERKNIYALHFNHKLRDDSDNDELFVKNLCEKLKVNFYSEKWITPQKKNIEKNARDARYAFFNQCIRRFGPGKIYLAHHIDDSFEWSLLQNMKSSELVSSIGIPVKARNIYRPLMCLTKKQILSLAEKIGIGHIEDSSNTNQRFERNFLRLNITNKLEERYPKHLKNYALKQNRMASKLGLSAFKQAICIKYTDNSAIIVDGEARELAQNADVSKWIQAGSKGTRGVLNKQIAKLGSTIHSKKWGPLSFSAGSKVFVAGNIAKMVKYQSENEFQDLDNKLLKKLQHAQIPELFVKIHNKPLINYVDRSDFPFPHIVFSRNPGKVAKGLPGLKRAYPLLPKSTQYLIDNGYWYRPMADFYAWVKRKEKFNQKFTLSFLVL